MAENGNGSGMNAVIALVGIVAIIVVAYLAMQMLGAPGTDNGGGAQIDVDLPGGTEGTAQ